LKISGWSESCLQEFVAGDFKFEKMVRLTSTPCPLLHFRSMRAVYCVLRAVKMEEGVETDSDVNSPA
jgi:hypothetical protein